MRSIMQKEKKCFICGSTKWLESHHVFGGPNKKLSEKFGLKVYLCHYCHNEPPEGVHYNKDAMDMLHELGQYAFEETHTREEFMQRFGRNYIGVN